MTYMDSEIDDHRWDGASPGTRGFVTFDNYTAIEGANPPGTTRLRRDKPALPVMGLAVGSWEKVMP